MAYTANLLSYINNNSYLRAIDTMKNQCELQLYLYEEDCWILLSVFLLALAEASQGELMFMKATS